jgi:hypothetical protein
VQSFLFIGDVFADIVIRIFWSKSSHKAKVAGDIGGDLLVNPTNEMSRLQEI